jgi:fermentation-respiration switch protein FrsA (DUF1100 family)
VPQLRVPILFISGLADELIPPAHMRRLYDLATNAKQRVVWMTNRSSPFLLPPTWRA